MVKIKQSEAYYPQGICVACGNRQVELADPCHRCNQELVYPVEQAVDYGMIEIEKVEHHCVFQVFDGRQPINCAAEAEQHYDPDRRGHPSGYLCREHYEFAIDASNKGVRSSRGLVAIKGLKKLIKEVA